MRLPRGRGAVSDDFALVVDSECGAPATTRHRGEVDLPARRSPQECAVIVIAHDLAARVHGKCDADAKIDHAAVLCPREGVPPFAVDVTPADDSARIVHGDSLALYGYGGSRTLAERAEVNHPALGSPREGVIPAVNHCSPDHLISGVDGLSRTASSERAEVDHFAGRRPQECVAAESHYGSTVVYRRALAPVTAG